MSSSDSSFSVARVSTKVFASSFDHVKLTLFFLLLGGGLGRSSGSTTGSRGSGSRTSRAYVGQKVLDVLALKSLDVGNRISL